MSYGPAIIGTEDADTVQGTEFSEEIYGLGGDDIVDGGGGDDEIHGGEGADHLTGGAGNDIYFADELDTIVELEGGGDDEVRTSAAAYALADHVERLTGLSGDAQELIGNGLDNIILGGSGSDVLRGGLGDDRLTGGAGDDMYHFSRGDGVDRIMVAAGSGRDALQFDLDIYDSHVTVTQSGFDLILTIGDGGGSVTLLGSGSSFTAISEILFGNNVVWSREDLLAYSTATAGEGPDTLTGDENDNVIAGLGGDDVLDGAGGNDILEGGDGDDLLRGGLGDDSLEGGDGEDVLAGGGGNDVYRFQPGSGEDRIAEAAGSAGGGHDRIQFLGNILPGDVTLTLDGVDVLVAINGSTDLIRIENMLSDPASMVEELAFADGTMSNISWLLGPQYQYGTSADDTLIGTTLSDKLSGGAGDDILQGKAGTDELIGGAGNDLLIGGADVDWYRYNAGDGNDVIRDEGGPGGWDRLFIGGGLQHSDTTVGRSADGQSYILYFHGGEESITLYGAASGDPKYQIEIIQFQWAMLRPVTLNRLAQNVSNGDDVITLTGDTYAVRGLAGNDTIHGSAGQDRLRGDSGDDSLLAGDGDDLVYGDDGTDSLSGGNGNDGLFGGAGDDLMTGGSGDDSYSVDHAGDSVVEEADQGDDHVSSTLAVYALPDHVERLTGLAQGPQALTGNGLDNSIAASSADDILEGRGGNDSLAGGGGSDIYRFARGDGDDVVTEYWNDALNAIEFTTGIIPGDVTVTLSGSDIILTVNGGGGSVTWLGGRDAPNSVEVKFADGTVWTYAALVEIALIGGNGVDLMTGNESDNVLRGMGGDDVLKGGYGNDVLEGGAASDLLSGGSGDDRYRFERGFGRDEILEPDASGGYGQDRIEFMGDILPGEVSVWTTDDGRDLLLTVAGTTDRIFVDDAFYDWARAIEEVAFADGTVWTYSDLLAMALPAPLLQNEQVGTPAGDTLTGGASGDILRGRDGADVIVGGEGSDELHGGLGADSLSGGAGDDYYFYVAGDGHDVIQESGGHDTIRIGAGLQRGDLTVARSADGLSYILFFGGGENSITLDGAVAAASEYQIEYIRFANGEGLTGAALAALALDVGNGDDVLTLSGGATALRGLGGDDLLYGSSGNDRLEGDSGDDMLSGGDGDDELSGGAGADLLIGGGGNDVYVVDNALDSVIEAEGQGIENIRTMLAVYSLPDHVERLTGQSQQAQELTGNALDNIIYGGSGNDILKGGLGNDSLSGGLGADVYLFSRGDGDDSIAIGTSPEGDVLQFGPGILPGNVTVTQAYFWPWTIVITVDQGGGSVTFDADFTFPNLSQVIFGDGTTWSREELLARLLTGTESGDTLTGDMEDNVLTGLGGNDVLDGHAGNDSVNGGNGNDRIRGGGGTDLLTGGAGVDGFYFQDGESGLGAAADRITDFVSGEDQLAISSYSHGPFTFIGTGAFSGTAGEVRYWFDGTDTWIQVDYSGSGSASSEIVLSGNVLLAASDFLF